MDAVAGFAQDPLCELLIGVGHVSENAVGDERPRAECGIEVDNITLEQVFPPLKTKMAFDEVAAAANTVDSMRSKAEQYAVQVGERGDCRL